MQTLKRNRQKFYFALFLGKAPLLDKNGKRTGEYEIKYTNPIKAYANISVAFGEAATEIFGINTDYDKILVLSNIDSNFNEASVLWIDEFPLLDKDGALTKNTDGSIKTPWDYTVKKIARTKNSVSVAAKKVSGRGYEQNRNFALSKLD